MSGFTQVEAGNIVSTCTLLKKRVSERFPDSGLSKVAVELESVSKRALERADEIGRPHWPLRILAAFVVVLVLGVMGFVLGQVGLTLRINDLGELAGFLESAINDAILIGAALFFIFSAESRIKRHRALEALRELRSLAHVIDMHQLTKDPESILNKGHETASSPKRSMTSYELNRYLDYCSEMLAMLSKIAALYGQHFDDGIALASVDQIETLTTGLSRKVWQKIMILHRERRAS
jgi:hypothetical protein